MSLNPLEEVKRFFEEGYPRIKTIITNLETFQIAGYLVISYFVLPKESWWTNYYEPTEAKIRLMKLKYKDNEEALVQLFAKEMESDVSRRYSKYHAKNSQNKC